MDLFAGARKLLALPVAFPPAPAMTVRLPMADMVTFAAVANEEAALPVAIALHETLSPAV